MSFFKRVVYMDYHENGEKVSNAGFVKLLRIRSAESSLVRKACRPQEWTCMQIHALNLPQRSDLWGKVVLVRDDREILLGRMAVESGRGMLQIKNLEEICEDWEKWKLKIEVTPAGNVWCDLGMHIGEESVKETGIDRQTGEYRRELVKVPRDDGAEDMAKKAQKETPQEEWLQKTEMWEENMRKESVQEENTQKELLERPERESDGYEQISVEEKRDVDGGKQVSAGERRDEDGYEQISVEGSRNTDGKEEISAREKSAADKEHHTPARMKRDKWQQLCVQLPHIHPFQDEREYLRLNLQDLLMLSAKYYRLVENSFLLHGFYNYEHLILARSRRRGGEKYYLGVPGNYYEREKQVAVWFGFESFEPKAEPASEGDFGYYMISVDI